MRHPISWADLRGRSVGLWGLGTEGRANLRTLRALGVEPVVVDDRPPATVDGAEVLATDAGGLDALQRCEVVVKTPGLSRHRADVTDLESRGVAVVGGLGLWLQGVDRSRVVCVTGTKGKSTTTAVLAHLATGLGLRVFAGGNLGAPPYDPDVPTDADLYVIEVSSYQAADVAASPPVVAVTSLHPDHLPWHGGIEAYYRDKLGLCSQPGARLTVASGEDRALAAHADLLGPEVRWIDATTWPDSTWAAPLGLLGRHSIVNAAIARACLQELGVAGADDDERLRVAAEGFTGLDSRLQLVATVGGVDLVDDGLATNVLPTVAAVDAFPGRRIALIAGGFDRDLDYDDLAGALAEREGPIRVHTVYTTGPRIQQAIDRVRSDRLDAVACTDLADAVARAWEWARPDGVVLLSPAAASFDAFDDYRHRSRVFADLVDDLAAAHPDAE